MKAERTIRYLATAFPTIFPNRNSVLNHLFLVWGNGFHWYKGELVESCGEDYEAPDKDLPDIEKWDDPDGMFLDVSGRPFVPYKSKESSWDAELEEKYPDCFPPKGTRTWSLWENDTDFWKNFEKIPKDITPDWKRVVDELIEKLLEDGYDVKNRKCLKGHEIHSEMRWSDKYREANKRYWAEFKKKRDEERANH